MTAIIDISAPNPDPLLISKIVEVLKKGGIIAYPTETFYGLGADCTQPEAVSRLYDIKGRAFNKPIALVGSTIQDLELITDHIPETARQLMPKFWPGPLTLIFQASNRIPPQLTAGTGKIGIRISSHPIARTLAITLGRPLTATSANLSGAAECVSAKEVLDQVGGKIDLLINSENCPGGLGSTMLDVTTSPPVFLRQGVIREADVLRVLQTHGN